jgi:hypothetical protein
MHVAYIAAIFFLFVVSPVLAAALPLKVVGQPCKDPAERAHLPASSATRQ